MTIFYPEGLPLGLHSGRTYQTVSPLLRSDLESGRARQRRRFTDTPTLAAINWFFTDTQARLFELWWRVTLVDGSEWFECPLKTPLGVEFHKCRFTDIYKGPSLVGPDIWSYSAELELEKRPVLPNDWSLLPSFVLNPEIFDYAMNREWPLENAGAPPLLTESGAPFLLENDHPLLLE